MAMTTMMTERSQLYYTCVFLQVSFRAIGNSITAADDETRRCWLDAQTLQLLLGELQRCRQQASPFRDLHSPLDQAIYHCGLLMAQCPGALDQRLCRHHLDAICLPLGQAIDQLAGKPTLATKPSPKADRRFRHWFGR